MNSRRLLPRLTLLPLLILLIPFVSAENAFGQLVSDTRYFILDISGTPNINDFPYGIVCPSGDFRYMSLFSQGAIAEINKTDNFTTIYDNNSVGSGEDWYSLINATNNKIYANYRDVGLTIHFDTVTKTFGTPFPVVPNIAGGNVTYFSSYNQAPNHFAVAGFGQVIMGFSSSGELKYTNGYVWQVLNAKFNFPQSVNDAGIAQDSEFNGIVRIDPTNNSVTRYNITGSSGLRGVTIDATDSTILWLTDWVTDKIFKFDTDSQTVVETFTIPTGSRARGIANDATHLYIAMNQGSSSGNSKILKVIKENGTNTIIDTGAAITIGGAFSVFLVPNSNNIIWTDESGHIGAFDKRNPSSTREFLSTTAHSDSNHFTCFDSDQRVYFAGKGSVVQGSFALGTPISSSELGNGGDDDNLHLSRATFGKSHHTFQQLVDHGIIIDNKPIQIEDNFWQKNPEISFITGTPHTITLKAYSPYEITVFSVGFGCKEVGKPDCETFAEGFYDNQGILQDFRLVQKDEVIDKDLAQITNRTKADCFIGDGKGACETITFILWFDEPMINQVVMLQAINSRGQAHNNWLNDGIEISGKNFNPAKIKLIGMNGKLHLTQIDKLTDIWIDQNGIEYERNSFDTFYRITPIIISESPQGDVKVMERNHEQFGKLVEAEKMKATAVFDSRLIQKTTPTFFTYEIKPDCIRPCDPLPNMMKAQIEFYKQNRYNQ